MPINNYTRQFIIKYIYVTVYGKTQAKSFFSDVNVYVLLIYIMCRIFCAKGITVSQIFCELPVLHFEIVVLENLEKWFFDIFEVWIKELHWNTINFNDIRCNFKALLNIFLHFGMDKIYQRCIFTKKKKIFITFKPDNNHDARPKWKQKTHCVYVHHIFLRDQ
jgi:hypothetical protein